MHIYETEYFNVTILFHMLAYGFSGYHNCCGNHSVHACLCSQTVYRIDCFTLGLASSSYACSPDNHIKFIEHINIILFSWSFEENSKK